MVLPVVRGPTWLHAERANSMSAHYISALCIFERSSIFACRIFACSIFASSIFACSIAARSIVARSHSVGSILARSRQNVGTEQVESRDRLASSVCPKCRPTINYKKKIVDVSVTQRPFLLPLLLLLLPHHLAELLSRCPGWQI